MNTLISSIASLFFGQVHTSSLHVEALPLINLNLMLRSKSVLIADFGGIESVAVARNERHPTQSALQSRVTAKTLADSLTLRYRSTDVAGVPRRFRWIKISQLIQPLA